MYRVKGKYPWAKKTGKVIAEPEAETPKQFRIEPPPGNFTVIVQRMNKADSDLYEAVDDYEITVAYLCLKMGAHEMHFPLANLDFFDIVRRNNGNQES